LTRTMVDIFDAEGWLRRGLQLCCDGCALRGAWAIPLFLACFEKCRLALERYINEIRFY